MSPLECMIKALVKAGLELRVRPGVRETYEVTAWRGDVLVWKIETGYVLDEVAELCLTHDVEWDQYL